jgi:hypothetical protein
MDSFENDINKTNFFMKDLATEDIKSINTNLSNFNIGHLSSIKLFKNNLTDLQKTGNSISNYISKDISSIGLSILKKSDKEKFKDKAINLEKEKYEDSWIDIYSQDITKIILIKVVDQCYFEGHLHLRSNLNTEYIIVKFINKKSHYMITPSIFFIKPRDEIIINIKRFCKLAPDIPNSKIKESLIMLSSKTSNKIDDLNDIKTYWKNEENIYSPNYQIFYFSLILDNGYNPIYYDKLVEDRKRWIEAFYSKTNINEIKDINTIRDHIEDLKINIKEYRNKINKKEIEFEQLFERSKNKNINEKRKIKLESNKNIIIDEEVFYEVEEDNNEKTKNEILTKDIKKNIFDILNDENGITIPMALFVMSIGLFVGKFIKFFIFE